MIELILNEHQELMFETDITGITNEKVDVSFVIENDGIGMSFKGNLVDGVVTVNFPILTNILEAKTYDSKLVFVIENTKYFEPMKTQVNFIQPISITTKPKKSSAVKKVVKEDTIAVEGIKINSVKVTSVKPVMERLEDSIKDLAAADSVGSLISIYNKEVLLKESADTNAKDAIDFIDAFCKDKYNKTFKEYIADTK